MNRVETLRRAKGAKQYEMAAAIGISAPRLSEIETGKAREIRIEEAFKIADFLGSPVCDVFPDAVPNPAHESLPVNTTTEKEVGK